jgi:hypothetical protein
MLASVSILKYLVADKWTNDMTDEHDNTAPAAQALKANDVVSRMTALKAIKSKLISTIIKMRVNSLGREVSFREVTVAEQKKLARIMIDNENRKDIVYDAQCAILKSICLEDDVDIYSLTEFDKIKLLLLLYQRNMAKHEITFVCPECHSENKCWIDFNNAIVRLDSFDISDKEFVYENGSWKFVFTIGYPLVSRVSQFYASQYSGARRQLDRRTAESLNSSINIDYINLFIKKMCFTDKSTGETTSVDSQDYTIDEILDVISVLPQDVMYAENGLT